MGWLLLEPITDLYVQIEDPGKDISANAHQDEESRRLMTIPGIGPVCTSAMQAFAQPMEGFRRGRDFAALARPSAAPTHDRRQAAVGQDISKMGQRDLRRLFVAGAMAVVQWAAQRPETADRWLVRMPTRKPKMIVAVALANRMARIVRALTKKKSYRASVLAPA